MAANNSIVKKSIQIDAGNTVRTVKSLKQEISDLRDELLNLEQGTQEYDEVQKQLQDDVEDLNTVMSAHKDHAEVLEGSYLDLQNQLKELKTAWKETNDEAERDVLGQKINELNDQLKEMDASIGDFHRNVGNYESAWNGLTGVMENGEKITDDLGKGIKAFGIAIGLSEKQVNGLYDVLTRLKDGFSIAKDITKAREETAKLSSEQTKAAATGTQMAASQKATGTAAKTMAASETAAAGATKGLSIAMKGLKAALVSTGIGAIVVLLGSLVGKLQDVRNIIPGLGRDLADITEQNKENLESWENYLQQRNKYFRDELDFETRMMESRGEDELTILNRKKEAYLEYSKQLERGIKKDMDVTRTALDEANKDLDKTKNRLEKLNEIVFAFSGPLGKLISKPITNSILDKQQKQVDELNEGLNKYRFLIEDIQEETVNIDRDIQVEEERRKHATEGANAELKKWADAVKDPKFQEAWSNLFKVIDTEGKSPVDVLKAQREAALKLLEDLKIESGEVEQYFSTVISNAENEWEELVAKEQEIFDESLTPVQRLENEKAEWVEKAERWGMDTVEIVRYYDGKIQEEIDKAADEAAKKAEETQKVLEAQQIAELEGFLNMVDGTLQTNEKLDALFNPVFLTDTAAGDIQQDIDNLQRLYDTQMEFLNGLLESADLTEEAYGEVEDRILELTRTFNIQMEVLKKEQEFQGKNFALLTRKQVANWNLMETAAQGFSDVFQSLGKENSVAFKGFATAQALISAILAANRVLAEEPGGAIIKSIAAASTLAAGLANVASIWAVNPDGSNANSVNPDMSQAVPVIGNSQPINYYRNVTEASPEDEMNKYNIIVKVSDIEDGLNERKAQVSNSSF